MNNPSILLMNAVFAMMAGCGHIIVDHGTDDDLGDESGSRPHDTGDPVDLDTDGWSSGVAGSTGAGDEDSGTTFDPWTTGTEDSSSSGSSQCIPGADYRACDPGCDQPCEDPSRLCLGPAGSEICTVYCTTPDASPCPPTEFQAPWDAAWCPMPWGFCVLPCDDLGLCPNPNVYTCDETATCWPDL